MLKFSKIFLLVFVFVLGGCCALFLTAEKTSPIQLVEAEESIYHSTVEQNMGYDCLMAPDENASGVSSQKNYVSSNSIYYTNSVLVVDTVFVNFSDCAKFDSSNYENFVGQLNRVSEYFLKASRGNLNVYFNINVYDLNESINLYLDKKMGYNFELNLYNKAYDSSVAISENYGEAQVRFLFLSSEPVSNCYSMFWAHAYCTKFIVMNSEVPDYVICHELYHTMGILDLYIGNDNIVAAAKNNIIPFCPVGNEDLMAACQSLKTPTSAYNRYLLGWLGNESLYSDNEITAIENIQDSNTYIINEAMQDSGTIAYKFGISDNEFFLIECRNVSDQNYLIVQRINKQYSCNLDVVDHTTCYIYSFRNELNSVYFGEGYNIGNDLHDLYYSNSNEVNFALGNIVDLGNNQMQFDFFTVQDTSVEKTFNLISASNPSLAISNSVVSINDIVVNSNAPSSLSLSVKEGDIIKIEHENYKTFTYVVSPQYINVSSGTIDFTLSDRNIITDISDAITYQIETVTNGIQSFIANSIKIYVNNVLQNFTNLIKLEEGDQLEIISNSSAPFCSSFIGGALTNNGSGNVTIVNKTIRIELNVATCNYYLNVRDSNNVFVNITSLYLFNNFTKEWDFFNDISIVYVNGLKVYALNHVPFYYTQVKVWHTSYNTTTIASTHINVGNNFYNIQLNKNIIQTTGDFISGIANNIKNWFA